MDEKMGMRLAMEQAELAKAIGEVPVGAVIVRNGEVVAAAYNRRETTKNALSHAETEAIYKACQALGGWRLWECEMFVTLEPCPMCAGAILNARLKKVTFGAYDEKNGAFGSVCDLNAAPFTYHPEVKGGVMAEECAAELMAFFKTLREKRKETPNPWKVKQAAKQAQNIEKETENTQ